MARVKLVELISVKGVKDTDNFEFLVNYNGKEEVFISPLIKDIYTTASKCIKQKYNGGQLDVETYEYEPYFDYDTTKDTISNKLREWERTNTENGLNEYLMEITK